MAVTTVHPHPRSEAPARTADPGALRRRELAEFLRHRRERLTPEQLGLVHSGRRRTPGLRREEVAQHAGVGVTWYTWLEQARDIRVSPQVLEAVARTLQLDAHERSHLFTLAGWAPSPPEPEALSITPDVRLLLDKLLPYPALVLNARYDVLAHNAAYAALIGDLDALPPEQRNTLWLTFASPALRAATFDWETCARRVVGQFRAGMAEHVGEPAWKCMLRRLQAGSPDFARMWEQHQVLTIPEGAVKRYRHPDLGVLEFSFTNLWLSPQLGVRLSTYLPHDGATAAALARIHTVRPHPLLPAVRGDGRPGAAAGQR